MAKERSHVKTSERATVKADFINKFQELQSVTESCRAVAIVPQTYYNWLAADPEFKAAVEKAMVTARHGLIEKLEKEVDRRAVEGVEEPVYQGGQLVGRIRKYSDVLLIFRLKGLAPERYRDNYLPVGGVLGEGSRPIVITQVNINLQSGDSPRPFRELVEGKKVEIPEGKPDV